MPPPVGQTRLKSLSSSSSSLFLLTAVPGLSGEHILGLPGQSCCYLTAQTWLLTVPTFTLQCHSLDAKLYGPLRKCNWVPKGNFVGLPISRDNTSPSPPLASGQTCTHSLHVSVSRSGRGSNTAPGGRATASADISSPHISQQWDCGQALYHLPFETKKGMKVIDKKINELIFVKCLEQSLTQGRHSVFAN